MEEINKRVDENLWSLASEAAVLGSMLIDPEVIPKARGIVNVDGIFDVKDYAAKVSVDMQDKQERMHIPLSPSHNCSFFL